MGIKERIKFEMKKNKMMANLELKPEVHRRALQHQIWINLGLIITLFGVYPDPNKSWLMWIGIIMTVLAIIAYVRRSMEAIMERLDN